MPTRSAELSPIARTVKDHGRITASIAEFDAILADRQLDGLLDRLAEMRPLFEEGLSSHFATEERFVFPAILLGAKDLATIECVLSLQKAHGRMEEEVRRIFARLDAGALAAGGGGDALVDLLARFLAELKAHALLESEELLPMAAGDQHIQRQLCRLIETRRDAEK